MLVVFLCSGHPLSSAALRCRGCPSWRNWHFLQAVACFSPAFFDYAGLQHDQKHLIWVFFLCSESPHAKLPSVVGSHKTCNAETGAHILKKQKAKSSANVLQPSFTHLQEIEPPQKAPFGCPQKLRKTFLSTNHITNAAKGANFGKHGKIQINIHLLRPRII